MAECTGKDIRELREKRKIPRWKLSESLGVSEDTLNRWESGKVQPTPEDVDRIGEVLEEPTLWHRWMISNCDSYRKRYMDIESYELLASVVRTGFHLEDIANLQKKIERDAMDGKIDNEVDKQKYNDALKIIQACITDTLQQSR